MRRIAIIKNWFRRNNIRRKLSKWSPNVLAVIVATMCARSDVAIGGWYGKKLGLPPSMDWATASATLREIANGMYPPLWHVKFNERIQRLLAQSQCTSRVGSPIPALFEDDAP